VKSAPVAAAVVAAAIAVVAVAAVAVAATAAIVADTATVVNTPIDFAKPIALASGGFCFFRNTDIRSRGSAFRTHSLLRISSFEF
jgi:hypothetical protein